MNLLSKEKILIAYLFKYYNVKIHMPIETGGATLKQNYCISRAINSDFSSSFFQSNLYYDIIVKKI